MPLDRYAAYAFNPPLPPGQVFPAGVGGGAAGLVPVPPGGSLSLPAGQGTNTGAPATVSQGIGSTPGLSFASFPSGVGSIPSLSFASLPGGANSGPIGLLGAFAVLPAGSSSPAQGGFKYPTGVQSGIPGPAIFTTGSLLYESSPGIVGSIPDIASGNVLLSQGVGVVPAYGKVSLTAAVSGILPVANGGTGLSTLAGGALLYSPTSSTVGTIADVAVGSVLISGGVGNAPSFASTVPIGTGITFTANPGGGTAATLNDYEVGTYTPTDNSGAGLVLTYNEPAQYIKIGKLVYFSFDLTYPSTASGAEASITLPFTCSSAIASISVAFNSSSVVLAATANGISSAGTAFMVNPGVVGAYRTNAQMSTVRISIGGTYMSAV